MVREEFEDKLVDLVSEYFNEGEDINLENESVFVVDTDFEYGVCNSKEVHVNLVFEILKD